MKVTLKFILVFALLVIQIPSQAMLIDIPDANFRDKIKALYPSCFVGNQLETSCSSINSATSLDLYNLDIADLSGIEYFTSLKALYCDNNKLTSLQFLPSGLMELYCENNQLTTLPKLPGSLVSLNCSNNPLTSLPNLNSSLTRLECNDNQLTSLPILPNSLTTLMCNYNQLITLPTFTSSLSNIQCYGNQLTSLPTLPSGVTYLNCSHNQLTTLPSLPGTLNELNCDANKLSSLPALPRNLTSLSCSYNQLTSLPTLPIGLKDLSCYTNKLTILPTLPSSVSRLDCYENKLTSIPTLPSGLVYLDCRYNQLSNLPTLPVELVSLYCYSNLLDFSDLENISKPMSYLANPQLFILPTTQKLTVGGDLLLDGTIGGSANQYQWYKNDVLIPGANTAIYSKANVTSLDAGDYMCMITSASNKNTVTGVYIRSSNVEVTIKADQSITFTQLANTVIGDAPFNLSATASSGLKVTYTSSNTSVATVSGNIITIVGAGTTIITASQAGNDSYYPALDVQHSFTVNPLTAIDKPQEMKYEVFPNPTEGNFQLKLGANHTFSEVSIINSSGEQVFQQEIESNDNLNFDISPLVSGIYLMQFKSVNSIEYLKIIKR